MSVILWVGGGVPSDHLPIMDRNSPYRDPPGPLCTETFTAHRPNPRTCSNLLSMRHVRLASGQLTSYWNAFLLPPANECAGR